MTVEGKENDKRRVGFAGGDKQGCWESAIS
jgi:hypothetical protein